MIRNVSKCSLGAILCLVLCGCSGLSMAPSVSPASFLLPGIGKAETTPQPVLPTPVIAADEAMLVSAR